MDIEKGVLEKILSSSVEFKRLYEQHTELKHKVEDMNKSKFLSADQELEKKQHQKQKLILKDKMETILHQDT
ncbi:MAG TPA: hypothetical protein DCX78_01170 [Nitrospina sp.]|jgi:hypothetical protein|nr:hypothetical protein [Nitrospinota bacterium]MBV51566.1 hypothetical protein [Nitrospinota bacterium]MDP6335971.1 hypothetical protein [Nitrospinaceae bacterium]MDP7148023.1 hypothetical protein [Nitrospinaceae bacterium]HAX45426.1 hypothetical protein [Nitrospina sp.]|tara:strand:+ start:978 stop:1193 length:216 start_codon:yes stop_codon:yes gene_type:complete